jgi:hypothetical protein
MKHEVCIGKIYNLDIEMDVPKRKIVINEAQRNILIYFANKRIDENGHPIYTINGCDFEIVMHFEDKPYFYQRHEEMEERCDRERQAEREKQNQIIN